jgi:hypothetical protein
MDANLPLAFELSDFYVYSYCILFFALFVFVVGLEASGPCVHSRFQAPFKGFGCYLFLRDFLPGVAKKMQPLEIKFAATRGVFIGTGENPTAWGSGRT